MAMHADGLILMAEELPQTFFDLRTGFAGELFLEAGQLPDSLGTGAA